MLLARLLIVETLCNFENNMELFSRISAKTIHITLERLMEKFKWYNNVCFKCFNSKINNHTGNFHQIFIIAFTRYEINKIGSFFAIYRYFKSSMFSNLFCI